MQKAWHAWTFVDFGQASSGQDGRAGGRGGGGYKTVAGACLRGRGACTQYDPRVIVGAKTLDPKCDAYYGSYGS